jgi:hypothetical protein
VATTQPRKAQKGGNEHVLEDKQGIPVSRVGARALCNDRLEFAE